MSVVKSKPKCSLKKSNREFHKQSNKNVCERERKCERFFKSIAKRNKEKQPKQMWVIFYIQMKTPPLNLVKLRVKLSARFKKRCFFVRNLRQSRTVFGTGVERSNCACFAFGIIWSILTKYNTVKLCYFIDSKKPPASQLYTRSEDLFCIRKNSLALWCISEYCTFENYTVD